MPRNARLRAYLVAAIAAAFLVSVGPAAPPAIAATPTTTAPADATPTIAPPGVIASAEGIATTPGPTVTVEPAAPATAATAVPSGPTVAIVATRTTTPARAATTRANQVIAIAKSKLGDRWVHGAAGPSAFDCSGLVIYSFRMAGVARIVGSGRHRSARALYTWFRDRGLASRTNGQRGDLVIWGGGTHVGIYLGNGMAISTLLNGVRVHAVRATTARFTAFLHTGIARATTTVIPRTAAAAKAAAKAAAGAATVTAQRVTTTALRLRSGPSAAARVLATLAVHTKVGVIRVAKDQIGRTWYRVLVGGRLGWLAGWFTRAS